jgi:hypothetical protein
MPSINKRFYFTQLYISASEFPRLDFVVVFRATANKGKPHEIERDRASEYAGAVRSRQGLCLPNRPNQDVLPRHRAITARQQNFLRFSCSALNNLASHGKGSPVHWANSVSRNSEFRRELDGHPLPKGVPR